MLTAALKTLDMWIHECVDGVMDEFLTSSYIIAKYDITVGGGIEYEKDGEVKRSLK